MSVQKSWPELQKMHRACRILADTLDVLARAAVAGVKTRELDRIARERIELAGARPSFLGYRGYPATLCISVNDQVIHGIPGERKLKDGAWGPREESRQGDLSLVAAAIAHAERQQVVTSVAPAGGHGYRAGWKALGRREALRRGGLR